MPVLAQICVPGQSLDKEHSTSAVQPLRRTVTNDASTAAAKRPWLMLLMPLVAVIVYSSPKASGSSGAKPAEKLRPSYWTVPGTSPAAFVKWNVESLRESDTRSSENVAETELSTPTQDAPTEGDQLMMRRGSMTIDAASKQALVSSPRQIDTIELLAIIIPAVNSCGSMDVAAQCEDDRRQRT
jgi:hypothetical protein